MGGVTAENDRFEVKKCKDPRIHFRPLKMETIQRLMSSSSSFSMW